MHVAIVSVYSQRGCTLKDVAGGYGTSFRVGRSWRARALELAKGRVARLTPTVLAQLAAVLVGRGHRVSVVDVYRQGGRHDPVPECDAALVLTSIVDAGAERRVLEELTTRGVHTIAFGAYASACPDAYQDVARAVIVGEPENLGEGLVDPALSGIVQAGYVEDLDRLPWPDWSPFDVAAHRYAFLPRPVLPVAAARGCAFGCNYCPWRVTAPFRERDPGRVAAEIAHLVGRYRVRSVAFRDPLFNLDAARVRALCRVLAPFGLRFSAELRADRCEPGQLATLHRAGLRSLEIGVESVDLELLRGTGRNPPQLAQIEGVVREAHRLGIRVICNFMFGLPGDREQNIRASVEYARRLSPFAVQFTVATPYPNTTLARQVRGKRLSLAPEAHTGWTPTFQHESLSPERLEALREWAYVRYHYRPGYALRFARQAAAASLAL